MHLYNFFFLPLNITNKKSSHSLCDAINLYYSENFALKPEISSAKRGQTLKLPKVERGDPLKILRDTDTDWLEDISFHHSVAVTVSSRSNIDCQ